MAYSRELSGQCPKECPFDSTTSSPYKGLANVGIKNTHNSFQINEHRHKESNVTRYKDKMARWGRHVYAVKQDTMETYQSSIKAGKRTKGVSKTNYNITENKIFKTKQEL